METETQLEIVTRVLTTLVNTKAWAVAKADTFAQGVDGAPPTPDVQAVIEQIRATAA